jgi:hypothetical protein
MPIKGTGVTSVCCLASRFMADPVCGDLKRSFQTMVDKYGSIVYDGILTWAMDPLFPEGRIKFINGIPYITGECSDPSKLTEPECLSKGECVGMGCENINTRTMCGLSADIEGTECSWKTSSTWASMSPTLKKLTFAR